MILNLNKDFFFGAFIWYLLLNCIGSAICGVLEEERPKKYSVLDNLTLAVILLMWILS